MINIPPSNISIQVCFSHERYCYHSQACVALDNLCIHTEHIVWTGTLHQFFCMYSQRGIWLLWVGEPRMKCLFLFPIQLKLFPRTPCSWFSIGLDYTRYYITMDSLTIYYEINLCLCKVSTLLVITNSIRHWNFVYGPVSLDNRLVWTHFPENSLWWLRMKQNAAIRWGDNSPLVVNEETKCSYSLVWLLPLVVKVETKCSYLLVW